MSRTSPSVVAIDKKLKIAGYGRPRRMLASFLVRLVSIGDWSGEVRPIPYEEACRAISYMGYCESVQKGYVHRLALRCHEPEDQKDRTRFVYLRTLDGVLCVLPNVNARELFK